jgi:hypothetical protein
MTDYKQGAIEGVKWQRCKMVNIANPYAGIPRVRLDEETVAVVGPDTFSQHAGSIDFNFDPALVIELRNPVTGDVIVGTTMTGMDLYVALYSLYVQKALERDAAV